MTRKIVLFFDKRLEADFRIIRFKKCLLVNHELNNVYMFMNDKNLWTKCKKRCVKINHTSNTKNYVKYNIQKGERQ